MYRQVLTPREIELQEEFLRNNKVTKIDTVDSLPSPYSGKKLKSVYNYRAGDGLMERAIPQDTTMLNYGGSENSAGVN